MEVATCVTRRRVDVVLYNEIGQRLAIEVWYKHRKEDAVIEEYKALQLPTLEMRVSEDDGDLSPDGLIPIACKAAI